jgi:hypothetical protein
MADRILNRVTPCNCGCKGTDSQHAASFYRVVRDVDYLKTVETHETRAFGKSHVIATGWARLPFSHDGWSVGYVVNQLDDGTWHRIGWCVLVEH